MSPADAPRIACASCHAAERSRRRAPRAARGSATLLFALLPLSSLTPIAGAEVITDTEQAIAVWESIEVLTALEEVKFEAFPQIGGLVGDVATARELLEVAKMPISDTQFADIDAAIDELLKSRTNGELLPRKDVLVQALKPVIEQLGETLPDIIAYDNPFDDGFAVELRFKDIPGAVTKQVRRVPQDDDPLRSRPAVLGTIDAAAKIFVDASTYKDRPVKYEVRGFDADGNEVGMYVTDTITPEANWFAADRLPFLIFLLVICGSVVGYIELARSGRELKIRKIAGLEAVEDAVGRATEMGRPMIYVPGILEINDIQTVASLIILGNVSRTAAEHDARVEVPCRDPLVMAAARETIQTSFVDAGRPEAYDERLIYFVSGEQFAYVANITGTMVRERPAACFYMGAFFAESLILAETGNMTGSIQIAGTAQPAQLPFFVAACDYTLMGEELFAASAYLSGEPHQLGSLKGQDAGKLLTMILVVVSSIAITFVLLGSMQKSWLGSFVHFLREEVLRVS